MVDLPNSRSNYGVGLGKQLKKLTDLKDDKGRTALHLAASAGNTDICADLINNFKLDVNARDEEGFLELHSTPTLRPNSKLNLFFML